MSNIVKRCMTGTLLIALFSPLSSTALASENYDERFSKYFTVRTGYALTEQGVKEALQDFDDLKLKQALATISVVGEQQYTSLVSELKEIYYRRPEDVDPKRAYRYRNKISMNYIRVYIARALLRCRDSEAESYAFEQVMKSPEMSIVPATWAVENLKYIVKHFGTDVSKEFDFLITSCTNSTERVAFGRDLAEHAFRELLETETYALMTNHPTAQKYSQVIQKIRESAPSDLNAKYNGLVQVPRERRLWSENLKLLGVIESNEGATPALPENKQPGNKE